jgi:hypothetical protein
MHVRLCWLPSDHRTVQRLRAPAIRPSDRTATIHGNRCRLTGAVLWPRCCSAVADKSRVGCRRRGQISLFIDSPAPDSHGHQRSSSRSRRLRQGRTKVWSRESLWERGDGSTEAAFVGDRSMISYCRWYQARWLFFAQPTPARPWSSSWYRMYCVCRSDVLFGSASLRVLLLPSARPARRRLLGQLLESARVCWSRQKQAPQLTCTKRPRCGETADTLPNGMAERADSVACQTQPHSQSHAIPAGGQPYSSRPGRGTGGPKAHPLASPSSGPAIGCAL